MKNKPQSVMPKLRFPEFQTNWGVQRLDEIAQPVTERAGNRPITPYTVMTGIGLISQQDRYGRTIAGSAFKNYYVLQKDDFAYNKSATKAYPQGYIARFLGEQGAVPNSIFTCFRVNPDLVNPSYLDYLFFGNFHGRWLRRFIEVSARAHGSLSIDDAVLMSLPVPVPDGASSSTEQRKIAACLESLDEWISAVGRKLEVLRAHRKALLQQLFPREGETRPSLRFRAFRDAPEWEDRKLDDLAERGTGHTPKKGNFEYYNGGIKWVSLADSKRLDRGLISETEIEISEEGIENSSAVLHPEGSVILSRDAGVGKSAILEFPMAVSQHFIVWTCDSHQLTNWFLYYILQNMKPLLERIATGSTIKTIGLPFFVQMRVRVPKVPEQKQIASCLCALDALIASESQKLDRLRAHKKGLLQQLFPSPAPEAV